MPQHDTLESKTQIYWKLSTIYNGRSTQTITTEKAITQINKVMCILDGSRPLAKSLHSFKKAIIHSPEPVNVIDLAAKQ